MARPKGQPKLGGRVKGTPNKVKGELRARIALFLNDRFDEAIKEWEKITEPKDKLKLYLELAQFGIPKLQAVAVDATVTEKNTVEDTLKELSEKIED